jgi:hypothetical protein
MSFHLPCAANPATALLRCLVRLQNRYVVSSSIDGRFPKLNVAGSIPVFRSDNPVIFRALGAIPILPILGRRLSQMGAWREVGLVVAVLAWVDERIALRVRVGCPMCSYSNYPRAHQLPLTADSGCNDGW